MFIKKTDFPTKAAFIGRAHLKKSIPMTSFEFDVQLGVFVVSSSFRYIFRSLRGFGCKKFDSF